MPKIQRMDGSRNNTSSSPKILINDTNSNCFQVVITTRDLLSHLSGIRHYLKKGEKQPEDTTEFSLAEYFLKEKFDSLEKAMELFQNDELLHEPGWVGKHKLLLIHIVHRYNEYLINLVIHFSFLRFEILLHYAWMDCCVGYS